jgi:hypothetical protein
MSDSAKPPPPVLLFRLTMGAWVTQAVSVAANLGIADALGSGPRPVDEIAETVGVDAQSLYRLMRALSDEQVFSELDGRRFALTPVSELLLTDAPGSLRSWAIMVGRPYLRDAWTDLEESIRTGETAFDRVHGQQAFDYFRANPEDGEVLNRAMTAISGRFVAEVVGSYDFSAIRKIVDVGGGQGALLAAILAANPHVHGVLYDLPHVIAAGGAPLKEAGVDDRCERIGGDFFESVPTGGDAYLLSNIIHDWDDDLSVRILANCRAALNDHGRVLLGEVVLPNTTEPHPAKWIDLQMLIMGSGRQRTEEEYRRLFQQAGLQLTKVVRSHAMFNLVEATAT